MLLELERLTDMYDNIYKEFLKDRIILLNGDIMNTFFETVAMQIKYFNMEDEKNNIPVEERKPIQIHIDSYGGSAYDGFSIMSAIVSSKTPVHGYCTGYVMSMGFGIFCACHKRFGYPFTSYMYHEVSTGVMGKNEEIQRVAAENKRLQAMYDGLIVNNTKFIQKELDKFKKSTKDYFFSSDVALEKGVIHEIIT